MADLDPREEPKSRNRRRLLLALGFGVAQAGVVYRFARPRWASVAVGPSTTAAPSAPSATRIVESAPHPLAFEPSVRTGSPPVMDDAAPAPDSDHIFDLVIVGGRVIDPESGFDGLANVGIDGTVVTDVTAAAIEGRETLDASGQIVAPGFVDILSYEPNEFGSWLKLADGVTTNLAMHGVNNYAPAFFRRYENRSPVHFGGAFHHHFMRGFDIGADVGRELTDLELDQFAQLAAKNLAAGFAGISFSPEYSPGTTLAEMKQLAQVASDFGHVSFFHVRANDPNEPIGSAKAIEEVLSIGRALGRPIHIEHLTSTGGTFRMAEALDQIDQARADGVDVTACVYPYDFWATFLGSERFADGWEERYRISIDDLQIAGTDIRLTRATLNQAIGENRLVAAIGSIPEDEIQMALQRPWVMVASDAIVTAGLNNHPRGAGTFARTIGRYVRDLGLLDLRTGLAKITILPAKRVEQMIPAMARKGRLQRGADADVVVFDPAVIADRATIAAPDRPSVGISWVVVGGQIGLRSGQVQRSVLAGVPLVSQSPSS